MLDANRLALDMKNRLMSVQGGADFGATLLAMSQAISDAIVEEIKTYAEVQSTGTVIAPVTGAGGGIPGPIQGTTAAPAQVTLPVGCVK